MHPETGEQYITRSQKAVDVGLAFNLLRSYGNKDCNKLYLMAGDGDFHEVIQHLVQNENVEVVVLGSTGSVSGEIEPFVKFVDLANIQGSIARPVGSPAQADND